MIVRPDVTFRSDLVDDGIKTEDGSLVLEWPGRLHALAVAGMLKALGYAVSTPVTVGQPWWDLEVILGGELVFVRVMLIESQFLFAVWRPKPKRTWYLASKPAGPAFDDMLVALDAGLRADGRFHDLRWLTPTEFHHDAPGAPTPLSEIEEMAGYVPPPAPPPRPWREWDHPWRDR